MKYNADDYQGFRVTNTTPKKSYKNTWTMVAVSVLALLAFLSPCVAFTVDNLITWGVLFIPAIIYSAWLDDREYMRKLEGDDYE